MKRIITAILTIVLALSLFSASAFADADFEALVKEGSYIQAAEYYQNNILGNGVKEYECSAFLSAYVSETLSDYACGQGSEAAAYGAVITGCHLDDCFYLLPDAYDLSERFEMVRSSKRYFDEAAELEQSADLAAAVEMYMLVSEFDTENYCTALERRKALAVQLAAEYKRDITAARDRGNYLAAIDIFMEAQGYYWIAIDEEMEDAVIDCIELYLARVRTLAYSALGSDNDTAAAAAVVREAINEAGYVYEILDGLELLIEEISSYAPVPLAERDPVRQGEYVSVGTRLPGNAQDVDGNTYDKTTVICPTGGDLNSQYAKTEEQSELVYALNYEYSTLSGIIYRPYSFLSCPDSYTGERTAVRVYGDGILLAELTEPGIRCFPAVAFELDVSGVRELRLVVSGTWKEPDGLGTFTRRPAICLADVMLEK